MGGGASATPKDELSNAMADVSDADLSNFIAGLGVPEKEKLSAALTAANAQKDLESVVAMDGGIALFMIGDRVDYRWGRDKAWYDTYTVAGHNEDGTFKLHPDSPGMGSADNALPQRIRPLPPLATYIVGEEVRLRNSAGNYAGGNFITTASADGTYDVKSRSTGGYWEIAAGVPADTLRKANYYTTVPAAVPQGVDWNDVDVVKAIMEDVSEELVQFASDAVKADRNFGMWVAENCCRLIEYLSEALRDDDEIAEKALEWSADPIRFLSARLRSERALMHKVLTNTCNNSWGMLEFVDDTLKDDAEFVGDLVGASYNVENLKFASQAVCANSSMFLRLLGMCGGNSYDAFNFKHVMAYADPLLRDDVQFMMDAVAVNTRVYECGSDRVHADKSVALAAVGRIGNMLKFASAGLKADREVVLLAARNSQYVYYTPDWELVLENAAPALRSDREVVRAAVEANGGELAFVGADLLSDRAFVSDMLMLGNVSLGNLPDDSPYRGDRALVMIKVGKCGGLQHASDSLRGDREVVLMAISQDGSALQWASDAMRDDREIVLEAMKMSELAGQFASARLFDEAEIGPRYRKAQADADFEREMSR